MTDPATICIIDDNDAVREALRVLLFAEGYQSIQFASADEFLERDPLPRADVLLLDIRMPGTDGMELHQRLVERGVRTPVIFITGHGDIPLAVAAMQRGAFDFLTKPFEEGELVTKIRAAVSKHRDSLEERGLVEEVRERFESLTARETDVMLNIIQGSSNKQVANRLNISPRTVEIHRARVMAKMDADSVATLVRLASLIDLDRATDKW